MNALIRAAADLQAVCERHEWQFCLTLLTGFGEEPRFVEVLVAAFEPRIPDAAAFASVNRVLLLRAISGVGLDIALGGLPFEASAVARSTTFTYPPDVSLRTCSAEDLIVLKAFADRPKDWVDVEGVLIRQAATLDWAYIRHHLAQLAELKEAPELLEKLERLRAATDR